MTARCCTLLAFLLALPGCSRSPRATLERNLDLIGGAPPASLGSDDEVTLKSYRFTGELDRTEKLGDIYPGLEHCYVDTQLKEYLAEHRDEILGFTTVSSEKPVEDGTFKQFARSRGARIVLVEVSQGVNSAAGALPFGLGPPPESHLYTVFLLK
jgi:hypothetical protein